MRVSKGKLSDDTLIEAGELGGKAMGLGFHVVSSAKEVGGAVGLVFTFGFVWESCTATGVAGSPQAVCSDALTDDAPDGGGGGKGPRGGLHPSTLESA